MIVNTIAIVGRSNVGKSTLFNRLIMERRSIIEDHFGVTRDRIYGEFDWLGKKYRLIDTGGFQLQNGDFQKEINLQVEIAIAEADIIIFLVSAKEGLINDDQYVAKLLRKSKKPVVVAVNKVDDSNRRLEVYAFHALGFPLVSVSSVHGIGIGDLLEWVAKIPPKRPSNSYPEAISFTLLGRPNVGKSSLVNALLSKNRVIVSDIAGTTRDAIDVPFTRDGQHYVVVDTAGIRRKGKVQESIEKYAVLRAMSALDRADVALLVIDVSEKIQEQDKHIAGYIHEIGKSVVIVANKWDKVVKDQDTFHRYRELIYQEFQFLTYAPIVFLSALSKEKLPQLLPKVQEVYRFSQLRVGTSVLNEVVLTAQEMQPPMNIGGKKLKIYYASQVKTAPVTVALFVNNKELMHFSYQRYLENEIRQAFSFLGNRIMFVLREKKS